LALLPGMLTPWLHERVVQLATRMPFAAAATEVAASHQVRVSEPTARRATERAGAAYVAVQTAQVAAPALEAAAVPAGPARQLLSVDGAMVPLVGGQWAEVKTLAIGELGEPVWDDRAGEWGVHTTALAYFSRLADADSFTQLALVETHRRGTTTAGVVCAVTDGAVWEQGFIDVHRPDAVRILDFPHAAAAVASAAPVAGGAVPDQQAAWLTAQCQELKRGEPAVVLDRLRAVAAAAADTASRATVAASLSYLEKRRAQIDYAAFRAAGYPIASGAVESANKLVVEARLKGAGMHWAIAHVNPMVALRTVACSDRWAEAWPQITAQVGRARRADRMKPVVGTGATAPTPPASPPAGDAAAPLLALVPTARDDGGAPPPRVPSAPGPASSARARPPAADHPWRRARVGRAQRGAAA
jgi:hypothetical protein